MLDALLGKVRIILATADEFAAEHFERVTVAGEGLSQQTRLQAILVKTVAPVALTQDLYNIDCLMISCPYLGELPSMLPSDCIGVLRSMKFAAMAMEPVVKAAESRNAQHLRNWATLSEQCLNSSACKFARTRCMTALLAGRDTYIGGDSAARYTLHRPKQTSLSVCRTTLPSVPGGACRARWDAARHVQREIEDYLTCGRLEHGAS